MAGLTSLRKPKQYPDPPVIPSAKAIAKGTPYAGKPPTWAEIMAQERTAAARYSGRDEHLDECWDLYDLINVREKERHPDGTPREELSGEVTHLWSRPAILVDRAVAAIEPHIERLILQCDPWDDRQATEESAQSLENFYRTQTRRWYQRWEERGNQGDPQPPMARALALLALIEGGVGKRYVVDPADPHVLYVEPVPLRELYPAGDAVLRVMDCTLAEARAAYREVREAYPAREGDDGVGDAYPLDEERVRIVVWSDLAGCWEAIAWDFAPDSPFRRDGERGSGADQWIKRPSPINLGFCAFDYGPLWFGSAMAPTRRRGQTARRATARAAADHLRYRHRGILSPLLETFDRATQYISIIATLANMIGNEPWLYEYDPNQYDEGEKPEPPSRLPGAVSSVPVGEKVAPIPVNPASADALRALLTLLMQEVGDANPPVLSGGGSAASGAERYLAQTAAQDYVIAPAQRYLCGWLETALRRTGELVYRKGRGKGRLFDSLSFRAFKAGTGMPRGLAGQLSPDDIAATGPDVRVRYAIDDPVKFLQLMNAWLQLHKEAAVDMDKVREVLGIEDGGRMDEGIALEKARQDPVYTKLLIGKAIKGYVQGGGDPDLLAVWASERLKEYGPQQQGGPPGLPSPPGGAPLPGMAPGPGMAGPPGPLMG